MTRIDRIESLLKQEISTIIQQEFRSNLGIVSIIHIKIAKDLANATVYYSHFGDKKKQQKTLEILNKSATFIKGRLSKIIRIKRIPTLIFKLDDSLQLGSDTLLQMNQLNDD